RCAGPRRAGPRAPVEPVVTEVPLTTTEAPAAEAEPDAPGAPAGPAARSGEEAVSKPEKVEGFTTVGVTWSPGAEVSDEEIQLLARTRTDGTWSEWTPLEYHDEHAPDPESPEAASSRPGTDPLIVGEVDEVQTKAVTTEGVTPEGLSMAVVEPGESKGTEVEPAAIDTAALDEATEEPTEEPTDEPVEEPEDGLELQAGTYTPKPQIYSRAQWGANEAMRDKSSLRYFEVHAGFVHHTVNANNYTADQVPGIIRSIYAYHTQTRGWSDVGYNFLVDRFGRIWEGRFGGVDRPVVGAHTSGYNDYAFAMSAIGNFETAQPSSSMLAAYGKLMAWKLSLHGIAAGDTSQRVGDSTFPAINGHRDAGSTACPGKYLYAQLANIRKQAAAAQASWSGRNRVTDLLATPQPDLVLRRGSDKKVFVLPTRGMMKWLAPKTTGTGWTGYDAAALSPDLTGDGKPDMLVRTPACWCHEPSRNAASRT
ncbi:peptidoglycan recognition protein family protein, partial [Nocardia salmonicida]|uniref:peptidoglycan recognition protein family protein n=1 Tax=Nocardia salmonicida TaxID=53431 RepID=UPI0033CABE15